MDRFGVLVVEDSNLSASAIRLALSRYTGWQFLGSASSAEDALDRCIALHPDVMTLDLNMPGGGGLEMLSDIKATCDTPVVIVSSSTYEGSPIAAEALTRGADACFDKRRVLSDVEKFIEILRWAASKGRPPTDN